MFLPPTFFPTKNNGSQLIAFSPKHFAQLLSPSPKGCWWSFDLPLQLGCFGRKEADLKDRGWSQWSWPVFCWGLKLKNPRGLHSENGVFFFSRLEKKEIPKNIGRCYTVLMNLYEKTITYPYKKQQAYVWWDSMSFRLKLVGNGICFLVPYLDVPGS